MDFLTCLRKCSSLWKIVCSATAKACYKYVHYCRFFYFKYYNNVTIHFGVIVFWGCYINS